MDLVAFMHVDPGVVKHERLESEKTQAGQESEIA